MENTVNKFEKYLAYERRSSKMTIRAYQTDLNQQSIESGIMQLNQSFLVKYHALHLNV